MAANQNGKRKGKGYFLGFAVAVLLPLSFFLYYNRDVEHVVDMPQRYLVDHVDTIQKDNEVVLDTIYRQIKDLKLVNQLGDSFDLNNDLKGKILAINFIFTRCKSTCPQMSNEITGMVEAFVKKQRDAVQFISISVDPMDSVPALRVFANRYTSQHDMWYFANGDQAAIYDFAKNQLGMQLDQDTPNEFIHSQNIVLIDSARTIRGYYDALDFKQLKRCADHIVLLKMERYKTQPSKK